MLTDLRLGHFCSTVSFSANNASLCSFNIPNESYRREDDGRIFYCNKSIINYRVLGIVIWCGIQKSQQRGGKLKVPSQVPVFL